MNHQNFKESINTVLEKYDKVAFNHLKKSIIKDLQSQYSPKSTNLQNENNLISALKDRKVSPENEILIFQKRNQNKKPAYFRSDFNANINKKALSSEKAKS